jgi:hypothetical protein
MPVWLTDEERVAVRMAIALALREGIATEIPPDGPATNRAMVSAARTFGVPTAVPLPTRPIWPRLFNLAVVALCVIFWAVVGVAVWQLV